MHHQQIAFVSQQGKHRGLAGNVIFHLQQRGRSFNGNFMLLRLAQFAPFRPAEAKHLMQYAGAFKGKRYRMQVTAWDFHLCLCGGCHLVLPSAYCDCKPAALDFVSMPSAKTSAAKTPGSNQSRKRKPHRRQQPTKQKSGKTKASKGSYDPLAPERVQDILNRLDQRYPNVRCALHHNNAWELLIATILSAQCTDVMGQ